MITLLAIALSVLTVTLVFIVVKMISLQREARVLASEKRPEQEIEKALERAKSRLAETETAFEDKVQSLAQLDAKHTQRVSDLDREKKAKERELQADASRIEATLRSQREIIEQSLAALKLELQGAEQEGFIQEHGLYQKQFNHQTSEEFQAALAENYQAQKQCIKSESAVVFEGSWTVNGKESEGKKMQKQYSKLLLRAFNGEADAACASVNSRNMGSLETRVNKSYEAINKLGGVLKISVSPAYRDLRIHELNLQYEYQLKIHQEREEQKELREQMKQEEKALQEMDRLREKEEQTRREKEKELEKVQNKAASLETEMAHSKEIEAYATRIKTLQEEIAQSKENVRKIAQAETTKIGTIYVLSNMGAFGENVFKIGMTRRAEPQERVNELSSASVPFPFDVHAFIKTDNAPALEARIHEHFSHRRVNLVNKRKEFFNVSLEEIQLLVKKMGLDVVLTRVADAPDWRETVRLRAMESAKFARRA